MSTVKGNKTGAGSGSTVKTEDSKGKNKPKGSYARFDARLTREQKLLFERAAAIRGFKSLSEFVIYYTSEAATIIIEKHNQILASEEDKRIFFHALVNPSAPNKALAAAARKYKEKLAAK